MTRHNHARASYLHMDISSDENQKGANAIECTPIAPFWLSTDNMCHVMQCVIRLIEFKTDTSKIEL